MRRSVKMAHLEAALVVLLIAMSLPSTDSQKTGTSLLCSITEFVYLCNIMRELQHMN